MIELISVGDVTRAILEHLGERLEDVFGRSQKVQIADTTELPWGSWNPHRGQYLAYLLLVELPFPTHPYNRVLGVTEVDIYAPQLNFVFGEPIMTFPHQRFETFLEVSIAHTSQSGSELWRRPLVGQGSQ